VARAGDPAGAGHDGGVGGSDGAGGRGHMPAELRAVRERVGKSTNALVQLVVCSSSCFAVTVAC
jgi:hypothetical protein